MKEITFTGAGPFAGSMKTLYTLFLPLTQQDGSQQPAERLAWIEGELVKRAGALSRYSPGQGLWVSPCSGILCRD